MRNPAIEKRIRWAGLLVAVGLLVQIVTMSWVHPLAFMTFLMIGCPLSLTGVLLYLYSLAARRD